MSTKFNEIRELITKLTSKERDELLRRLLEQQTEKKREKNERIQNVSSKESESAQNIKANKK